MERCIHCGAKPVTVPTCWTCGKDPRGGSGNILVLLAWLFIPFLIPVYPILGSLSFLVMAAIGWITVTIGLSSGFRIIAIAAAGYAALFISARIERAASRNKAYRTLRAVIRLLVCAVLILALLHAPERDISRANAMALAIIGVPLLYFIARRSDWVFGFGGPPRIVSAVDGATASAAGAGTNPDQTVEESGSGFRVKWRDAAFFGLIPAFIGFFIGREDGLFLGAFLWLSTVAIIVGWRLLHRGVTHVVGSAGNNAAARRGFGGVLPIVVLGAMIGTAAGAVLLATSGSGHVELADVVAFAIMGVVAAGIFAVVRKVFTARR